MPRRPTKAWWKRCIKGVESRGGAIDPASVCGAVWARKPQSEREAIARKERRNPAGPNLGLVAAGLGALGVLGWLLFRAPSPPTKPAVVAPAAPQTPLTSPPDAPVFPAASSDESFTDPTPGVDLWVDTRLPGGGWNGWTKVQRFTDFYQTPPGSVFPQRVSAQSQVVQWLDDHANELSGAWSSATWTGSIYEDVRYGLFGADVAARADGEPIATYDANGRLEKGYV